MFPTGFQKKSKKNTKMNEKIELLEKCGVVGGECGHKNKNKSRHEKMLKRKKKQHIQK